MTDNIARDNELAREEVVILGAITKWVNELSAEVQKGIRPVMRQRLSELTLEDANDFKSRTDKEVLVSLIKKRDQIREERKQLRNDGKPE